MRILLAIASFLGVFALVLLVGPQWVHDREAWNPFAPLRVEAPPSFLTRLKLWRLSFDDALCRDVLGRAGLRYEPIADHDTGPGCGFRNAVRVERTSLRIGEPFSLSCRTAVALALWERHVLQRAAAKHLGEAVVAIEHFGSYACRNVYGRQNGRRSLHATADALDVAGFVLASGRRIRIVNDWQGDGAEARFLREAHGGACRVFDAVLGPDHNRAHRDHFHLDRGSYRVCR